MGFRPQSKDPRAGSDTFLEDHNLVQEIEVEPYNQKAR